MLYFRKLNEKRKLGIIYIRSHFACGKGEIMKAIIGLGNPGSKYEKTKHNIGFMAIEQICALQHVEMKRTDFEAEVGSFFLNGEKILLIKPLTFMNESGRAVGPLLTYYNISLEDTLVIYDDLDLAVGKVRLRKKGSAGGHNGIKSLIAHLKTEQFYRIKVGIGRPKGNQSVVHHVLAHFDTEDQLQITKAIKKASQDALYFVSGHSFQETMNFSAKE